MLVLKQGLVKNMNKKLFFIVLLFLIGTTYCKSQVECLELTDVRIRKSKITFSIKNSCDSTVMISGLMHGFKRKCGKTISNAYYTGEDSLIFRYLQTNETYLNDIEELKKRTKVDITIDGKLVEFDYPFRANKKHKITLLFNSREKINLKESVKVFKVLIGDYELIYINE